MFVCMRKCVVGVFCVCLYKKANVYVCIAPNKIMFVGPFTSIYTQTCQTCALGVCVDVCFV